MRTTKANKSVRRRYRRADKAQASLIARFKSSRKLSAKEINGARMLVVDDSETVRLDFYQAIYLRLRTQQIKALGNIKEFVLAGLSDCDPNCRTSALESLILVNAKEFHLAIAHLALRDPAEIVRATACEALSPINSSFATEVLLKAIDDPYELVRIYALRSLLMKRKTNPTVVRALEARLKKEKQPVARLLCIGALLASTKRRALLKELMAGLDTTDWPQANWINSILLNLLEIKNFLTPESLIADYMLATEGWREPNRADLLKLRRKFLRQARSFER